MCMVVAVGHAIVAGIFRVVVPIGPAVCLKVACDSSCSSCSTGSTCLYPCGAIHPSSSSWCCRGMKSNYRSRWFSSFCFKVVWRFYFQYFAVQRLRVMFASRTMRASPEYSRRCRPAREASRCPCVVDDYSRIEGAYTCRSWVLPSTTFANGSVQGTRKWRSAYLHRNRWWSRYR